MSKFELDRITRKLIRAILRFLFSFPPPTMHENNFQIYFSDNSEPYGGWITTSIYFILNCNLVEAIFLYFSFKAIKAQTEISQDLIGPTQYKNRKR